MELLTTSGAQQNDVEQALNKAIDAHSAMTFNLIEGLIMAPTYIPGKYGADGKYTPCQFVWEDGHIVDYEPEKMAGLVTKGRIELRTLTLYRSACENYARIHNGLDETRERRYQNVVAALELLSSVDA